jgi:large subunit ribosomal protein L5
MYDFLDKLVSVALPRIRDFQGLNPNSFDGHGNYTLGITEQLVFPEVKYDDVTAIRGLDITIVTTAGNDEEALSLLLKFGMPIRQKTRVE